MKLSLAELVDRLIIVNLKIWHMEETIRDRRKSDAEVGRITRMIADLNELRTELKNEIDEVYGPGARDVKVYGPRVGRARGARKSK